MLLVALATGQAPAQTAAGAEVQRGVGWLKAQLAADGSVTGEAAATAAPLETRTEVARTLLQLDQAPGALLARIEADATTGTEAVARRLLVRAQSGGATDAHLAALSRLRHPGGSFGAAAGYAGDALSSAWAVLALAVAGADSGSGATSARSALLAELRANGALSSLSEALEVEANALALAALSRYPGSPEVTAARSGLGDWLMARVGVDGGIAGDVYLTALALEALATASSSAPGRIGMRAWLLARQRADGSFAGDPFLTAVALRALAGSAGVSSATVIVGRAVDGLAGTALAGVDVRLAGGTALLATSAADGRFRIDAALPGSASLVLSRTGYAPATLTATLAPGSTLDVGTIRMTPLASSGIVRGVVTQRSDGAPLAGVAIVLSGPATRSATTDAAGRYEFADVPPGAVTLVATLAGYQSATGAGALAAGQVLLYSPALLRAGETAPGTVRVRGRVVASGTGAALPGASISVDGAARGSSGSDGRFALDLPAGSYALGIALAGYRAATINVLLAAGADLDLGDIALAAIATSATVSGTVRDLASAAPIAGALLEVPGSASTRSDADGRYRIAGIAAREFELRTSAPGYVTKRLLLFADEPGEWLQDVELAPEAGSTVEFEPLVLQPDNAGPDTWVRARTRLVNRGTEALMVAPTLLAYDGAGIAVGSGTAFDGADRDTLPLLQLAGGAAVDLVFRFQTGQFRAGPYQLVARASLFGTASRIEPLGRVLAERAARLSISERLAIAGGITADPPVLNAAAPSPVALSASVRNVGNQVIGAGTFELVARDTAGAVVHRATAPVAELAVGAIVTVPFPAWTPSAASDYRLEAGYTGTDRGLVTGRLYVGSAARAEYTLDRSRLPTGTQRVNARIDVFGQDVRQGAVSDPLAPLIRSAVQRAVAFNDRESYDWTLRHRCLGCHVQTQAIVGGETNNAIATYDRRQRTELLNSQALSIIGSGAIDGHTNFHLTQTMLGLWSIVAFEDRTHAARILPKPVEWLLQRQAPDGSWTPDHSGAWYTPRVAFVATIARGLRASRALLNGNVGQPTRPVTAVQSSQIAGGPASGVEPLPDGSLLVTQPASGRLLRVAPDGAIAVLASGLAQPLGLALDPDGTPVVATASGVFRIPASGTPIRIANVAASYIAREAGGGYVFSSTASSVLYRLEPSGQLSILSRGGAIAGVGLESDGSVIAAATAPQSLRRIRRDGSFETVAGWLGIYARPRALRRDGDGWLLVTAHTVVRFDAAWRAEILMHREDVPGAPLLNGVGRLPDGALVVTTEGSQIVRVTRAPLDVAALTSRIDGALARATTWLLRDDSAAAGDHIQLAQRLIGLGEVRQIATDESLRTQITTRMRTVDALLRQRQRADGSWSRTPSGAGDSLVTAMVGYALDYLEPSPSDPVVRAAVQWLLSTQAGDGSWTSENRIVTTREAATTWVAIWLPIALDRIGGIDTTLGLTLPSDRVLSRPSVAPSRALAAGQGATRYEWDLVGVGSDGRRVEFLLDFLNLKPQESRPAGSAAELRLLSSFTGQPVSVPITIPSVRAESDLVLSAATDRPRYGALSPFTGSGVVGNRGPSQARGYVDLSIRNTDGAVVAELERRSFERSAPGSDTRLDAPWNTGATPAGDYVLHAELFDELGQPVASASAPFAIDAGSADGRPVLAASVATDRVVILARIANRAINAELRDLTVRERIERPDGSSIEAGSAPIPLLPLSSVRELSFPNVLERAPEGRYVVVQTVSNAAGTVLDTQRTEFRVEAAALPDGGLRGTLAAQPRALARNAVTEWRFEVRNAAAGPLTGLPTRVRVFDPATGNEVDRWSGAFDLAVGGGQAGSHASRLRGEVGQIYIGVLGASVGNREVVLAQDNVVLVNRAPSAAPDTYAYRIGRALEIAAPGVLGNDADPDADVLRAALLKAPANGALELRADGSFRYVPRAGFRRSDSFTYQVLDGYDSAGPVTVTLTTSNQAPAAVADSYTVRGGQTLVVPAPGLLANDADPENDTLRVEVMATPSQGTLAAKTDGGFSYTPQRGYAGNDVFRYRVLDSDGAASNEASVTIGVLNNAPAASDDSFRVASGQQLLIAAPGVLGNDADPDGDPLRAEMVQQPAHGTLTLESHGGFSYRPNAGYGGIDRFRYRAFDGKDGRSEPATVAIEVGQGNQTPLAMADRYLAERETPLVVAGPGVLANDRDPDGNALSAALFEAPANGSVTLDANGGFRYVPRDGFVGEDRFRYRASDGRGLPSSLSTPTEVSMVVNNSVRNIPTGDWRGLVLLVLLLGGFGLVALARQRAGAAP